MKGRKTIVYKGMPGYAKVFLCVQIGCTEVKPRSYLEVLANSINVF